MKTTMIFALFGLFVLFAIGYLLGKSRVQVESFQDIGACNRCNKPKPSCCCRKPAPAPACPKCSGPMPCGCGAGSGSASGGSDPLVPLSSCPRPPPCKPCEEKECDACAGPDPTKWVLKTTVPPCPPIPDMSRYMLKTECPAVPDMSKYVLKTSIPSCPPCIASCSKPCKIGECPPCPRARCPVVQCPEPKACPACPSAVCEPCAEPDIKCKASYEPRNTVRPMLASSSVYKYN